MTPANFPERKRKRQLGALGRLQLVSKKGKDNSAEFSALHASTAGNRRDVRTKKDRTGSGKFLRA